MIRSISRCRVCDGDRLDTVMAMGVQALTGVFPRTRSEKVTAGPIEVVKCYGKDGCGLVQLKQSYALSEMYGMNYGYRSGLNASMVRHLHSKVAKVLSLGLLKDGDLVIDVGSNDATTLRAYPPDRYELVGIDPTGVKFSSYYPPGIKLIPEFFSAKTVERALSGNKAKVITSFSMFYDLEDPVTFAREIACALDDEGVWIFEQSYLPAMLRTNSFDTICHEHLEFYTLKQINWIAEKTGLKILDVEFNDVNGGSFSVVAAKKMATHRPNIAWLEKILSEEKELGLDTSKVFYDFNIRVERARAELMDFLINARKEHKRICGLGASTKGNVLLQYYGISSDLVEAIAEINTDKIGCFTPGTYIPILSQSEVLASRPDYLLVLPWHFRTFFLNHDELKGRKLIFPLPNLEIVHGR